MVEVRIPKMGMATVEVDVVKWYVGVGSVVRKGSPLVELESEKTTMIVEAQTAGIVTQVLIPEGATANAGDVLCRIRQEGDAS
ncbi:MAG: biotin/lipoyl-containing protein [Bacillota bacterium]